MNAKIDLTVAGWGAATDVFRHLAGEWRLDRRVDGRSLMRGRAIFSANDDRDLAYHEHGRVHLAGGQEFEAERRYLYRATPAGFAVFFAEVPARLFHDVALQMARGDLVGQASHLCGEDRYLSRYQFLATGTFQVRHEVLGPRKKYLLETSYRRDCGSQR